MNRASDSSERPIVVFQHLAKTGGVTFTRILQSTYGLAHCSAGRHGRLVSAEDIDLVMRVYPRVRAISGHGMRAYVDFGVHERRFRWFTMLRDPAERFFSHYRFHCRTQGLTLPFDQWCVEHGERRADLQVRELAGALDVEKAKQILTDRFVSVGDQADFDASLRFFGDHIDDERFPTSTSRIDNAAPADAENYDRELAESFNVLDRELYSWFRKIVWPRQEREHIDRPERPFADNLAARWRRTQNRAYRRVLYNRSVSRADAAREQHETRSV